MKKDLPYLRKKIDVIDAQLIELIYKRAHYVNEIGAYKKKNNVGFFNLNRELEIIKKIIDTHKDIYPLESLFYLWREMIGGMLYLQSEVFISVYVHDFKDQSLTLIRDFFGHVLPIHFRNTLEETYDDLTQNKPCVVFYLWPDKNVKEKWWPIFAKADFNPYKVTSCLPFKGYTAHQKTGVQLLAVHKIDQFKSIGKDHTLCIVEQTSRKSSHSLQLLDETDHYDLIDIDGYILEKDLDNYLKPHYNEGFKAIHLGHYTQELEI